MQQPEAAQIKLPRPDTCLITRYDYIFQLIQVAVPASFQHSLLACPEINERSVAVTRILAFCCRQEAAERTYRYWPQLFGVDADLPVFRQRTDHHIARVGNAEIHRFAQLRFAVRPVLNSGEMETVKFQVIQAGLQELHAE